MDLINTEETVDGVEDLIDIDMLLDDDNFIPIAFDWFSAVAPPIVPTVNTWPVGFIWHWGSPNIVLMYIILIKITWIQGWI